MVLVICLIGLCGVATATVAADSAPATGVNATTAQDSATSTPAIDLALDGRTVDDERRIVQGDPTLTINASVGSSVPDGTTIESVVIRVNGGTYRSYSPEESPTEITADLPLNRGNNSVTVIVEDSADNVNSREIDVAKDDLAPWIGLTAPYQSKLTSSIPNGTTDTANETFGVRAGDFSGIDYATVTVDYNETYESEHAGQTTGFSNVETIRIDEPGKRFTQNALLGYGNNTVSISVVDDIGNRRTERFNLEVVDDQAPSVAIDLYPEQTTNHQVELSGTIEDNVWLRNASMQVVNLDRKEEVENVSDGYKLWNYSRQLKSPQDYDHDDSGRTLEFEERIDLQPGLSEVTIRGTDHLGNTVTRTIQIERLESATQADREPPTVTIDRNKTRLREDGRVRLVASVSDPDWDIDNIAIETSNLSSGEIYDFEQFRSLGNRNEVSINTSLRSGTGNGTLVVRASARDREGQEDVAIQQLKRQVDRPSEPETDPSTDVTPTTTDPTTRQTEQTPTESTPTSTPANSTTEAEEEDDEDDEDESGGLLGGLVGAIVGFVIAIVPFVVGGIVFVTVSYFVLRRVREEGSESAG
ncbi:hypothetical protein [Halorientalis salina]|uniref:hypothetical protein n=1 Tax=Halorientalis salina TaxID=2932266 RepID=UPI00145D3811|nr:hypothetical protein [Halorientalis salina]